MGFYIETNTLKDKARLILEQLGGIVITEEAAQDAVKTCTDCAVVCVVDNGPFEAAAYCHSLDEYHHFTHPTDTRPKIWLLIENKGAVEKLTGFSR